MAEKVWNVPFKYSKMKNSLKWLKLKLNDNQNVIKKNDLNKIFFWWNNIWRTINCYVAEKDTYYLKSIYLNGICCLIKIDKKLKKASINEIS